MPAVVLTFAFDAAQPDQAERWTRLLQQELRKLGLVRVDRGRAQDADGAKSALALEIGQLVLTGTFSAAVVTAIAQVIVARINRGGVNKVSLGDGDDKIELVGISQDELRKFTELTMTQLAAKQPTPPQLGTDEQPRTEPDGG